MLSKERAVNLPNGKITALFRYKKPRHLWRERLLTQRSKYDTSRLDPLKRDQALTHFLAGITIFMENWSKC